MEEGFEWVHECGLVIKRLPPDVARDLYPGHEVASHSLTHPYMQGMDEGALMWEMGEDKKKLTVSDLLELFTKASGTAFASDRALLS